MGAGLTSRPEYTALPARVGPASVVEHRVARRARPGSAVTPLLVLVLLLLAALWIAPGSTERKSFIAAAAAALALLAASRSVLYQSLTPLPALGLQLATTRGLSLPLLPPLPLSTTRRFVPLADVDTVVIHEGLVRFNVRFYLAVVRRGGRDVVVAFDEVHPALEVLKEVYHAAREQLFDEYDEGEGAGDGAGGGDDETTTSQQR
ncbi:hypothetical protein Q8F55_006924 [Vanrija albida]|uniref:Phosphatidylinositol N-acetylglucosaminyltransferase subunit H conserved domain-containing protein n=1 Tax=Vanrija albida TaxID=181172 RepID=A0ABR3PYX6_9TREE